MNMVAFLSYILLTSFTPGPNNIIAMSNSGRHGFRRGFSFCLGTFLGFIGVMGCCAIFAATLFHTIPVMEPYLAYLGAAYILWLAWSIYRDNSDKEGDEARGAHGVLSGMVLQFVNVKVILYGITAMTIFVLPHHNDLASVLAFMLLLSAIGFVATVCWSMFGSMFRNLFNNHRRLLNTIMALLLVYCAVASLW